MFVFTICSNNYLAQAIVLGNSVKEYNPAYKFIIFLVDEKSEKINYNDILHEVVPVYTIEPNLNELISKYDIIELNTCVKPRVFQYLVNVRTASKMVYLDPDTMVFSSLNNLENLLNDNNIVLTPHINTPISIDGFSPKENLFLNYGIYNLGFIGLKTSDESSRFLEWWKKHTYNSGYNRPEQGVFVDQLPINHAHIFFNGVFVLKHMGYNMSSWNLHERFLSERDNTWYVNKTEPLIFYHFSSFKIDDIGASLRGFSRFTLNERNDLLEIHKKYNEELKNANYFFYKGVPCKYVEEHNKFIQKQKKVAWDQKPFYKKIGISILRLPPFRRLKEVFQHSI